MAAAGLGDDLLLANEVLDVRRLGALVRSGARVTVAVDSPETVAAAAAGGVREVLVDVNVGLPRCGCPPQNAGGLADAARRAGLEVRGVMGYEGHVMLRRRSGRPGPEDRGGDGAPAAGRRRRGRRGDQRGRHRHLRPTTPGPPRSRPARTRSWTPPTERSATPFGQALSVLGTVISVAATYAVADSGSRRSAWTTGSPPSPTPRCWFCSDEHTTFAPETPVRVGDRVRVLPAHVDPTVVLHERMHLVDGAEVVETWDVDMRGW